MRKLLAGIVDFRKNLTDEFRHLFAQLALGQCPDTLLITCSDSRVAPNAFASTNPGDLFVVRNVGNMVPPSSDKLKDNSVPAALEFSLNTLKVSDIVVCGHSECGAIASVIEGRENLCCPHLKSWLKYGEDSYRAVKEGLILNPALPLHNQVSQANVLEQIKHLHTYEIVQKKLEDNTLRIHGWWFDIANADVYSYEASQNKFVLIDENEAELILSRFSS